MRASELARKGPNVKLGDEAHRPNPKSPWAGKIKGGVGYNEAKDKAAERHVNKWRLKQALRQAGLHHSLFTKPRTQARVINYREALSKVPTALRKAIKKIWGDPWA